MPFTLTMPKLSPTMESGTLVKWHKNEGDQIQAGDLLFEVTTDKATVEHTALDEGWLRKILIQEGQDASVNQALAIMTTEKEENIEGYQPANNIEDISDVETNDESKDEKHTTSTKVETEVSNTTQKKVAQPQFAPEPPLKGYVFDSPSYISDKKTIISPLAKKIANEKNLDISQVKGTGPNGRIVSKDLENAPSRGHVPFGNNRIPKEVPGSYEEIPLSSMRKVIGQRLQDSKSFIPHFYVSQVIDAGPICLIREQLKAHEIKFSVNDFIVKACALTLKLHPTVNSGFNTVNQSIIQFKTIDIAIAVSIDGGLITPIVRHADFKNLHELSIEIRELSKKAKTGKLEAHEFKGGSFTISNLGMYGISQFQAIINPPQSAILAVGGIQEMPVVKQGKIIVGQTIELTLSVDHRVIDGVAAAQFLQDLKKYLETPSVLLI